MFEVFEEFDRQQAEKKRNEKLQRKINKAVQRADENTSKSLFEVFENYDKELESKRQKQILENMNIAVVQAQQEQDELKKSGRTEVQAEQQLNESCSIVDQFSSGLNNAQAFDELIKQIRESSNANRDYGTKFETLIKDWLTKDSAYKDLFIKVQTYKEWANEHPEYVSNARDVGIDLVATNADDNCFSAIQCKMYKEHHSVAKAGIDSFISASDKNYFSRRYIVATNEKWSENVQNELSQKERRVPINVIKHSDLASSNVDWAQYAKGNVSYVKPRTLRPYQKDVIAKVILGFKEHDRGKLIMACGTGKTFTSMKLVEQYLGKGGFILFLVPSLNLLSQTLSDWKRHCSIHINAFAVCSDTSTGKADASDIDSLTVVDQLSYPATTNAKALVKNVLGALTKTDDLTVIFSTYQSIEVIGEAQRLGLPELNLIICDEAHRTAGVTFNDDEKESNFVKVHDNAFLKSQKRLYMTATPKIYGSAPKEQQSAGELTLYSMDDEATFGPQFASIPFTRAIDYKCLVDYKVVVLTLDESFLETDYNFISTKELGGLSVKNAAKIVGSWRALSKIDLKHDKSLNGDIGHMKRAVGFARVIESAENNEVPSSKQFARYYTEVVDAYKDREKAFLEKRFGKKWDEEKYDLTHSLKIESNHIDGSMSATQKDALLSWLREEPAKNTCKILFNVR